MLLTHAGHAGGGAVDVAALLAALGLGLFHGVNPAMGWLFALSYGLQEKSRRALLRSLAWIVLGHELSVLPTALVVTLFASQVSRSLALGAVALVLLVVGAVQLLRSDGSGCGCGPGSWPGGPSSCPPPPGRV